MADYQAPVADMQFVLEHLVGVDARIATLPGFEEAGSELCAAVLEEAGKFTAGVIAPLNRVGDTHGCRLDDQGTVHTAPGWKPAYDQFCHGGWNGISCPAEFDGQGLPQVLGMAVREMLNSADISFALAPLLTAGAVSALLTCASDELKALYLPRMVSGEWTGTMNLTEPQAGSDLAQIRTRAEPQPDGSYRLFGQKIFITYGDHDLTTNIVHLVLARLPDAPAGVKGISLFLVPKRLLDAAGQPGERNDVRCVSLEHKLGIHASPTCVMAFGDQGGAVGHLLGEANRGLEYMFIMMNEARLGVGVQGLAVAERAYQLARNYADERLQSRNLAGRWPAPIAHQPDVARMLLRMRAQIEAARALAYSAVAEQDIAHTQAEADVRARALARAELLTPIVKGWSTEMGVEVASLGVQVHGGMGYIEETGAAQHLRDARITTIYEGTTAIQANDLLGRKLARDNGSALGALLDDVAATVSELRQADDAALASVADRLEAAVSACQQSSRWLLNTLKPQPGAALAGAVPYLMLCGLVSGGWMLARSALIARRLLAAGEGDEAFLRAKLRSAHFFAEHLLPHAQAEAAAVMSGSTAVLEQIELAQRN